jgi:protein gp37
MAKETAISWTKSTFNPWIGCTKIGPGCDDCYAWAGDVRFHAGKHWGAGAPRSRTTPRNWKKPLSWDREAAETGEFWPVFCASQADVFDNEVDPSWREDLWELIRACPNLTWQLVTKRAPNILDMLPHDWGAGWKNVWLIATVVTQKEFERDWPRLSQIPAAKRGLSIEPQIEEIDITWNPVSMMPDWIICGGESSQFGKSREFDIAWAERLRNDCQRENIAFFMKQLGSKAHHRGRSITYTGKGDNPAEWPEQLRVQEFPIAA